MNNLSVARLGVATNTAASPCEVAPEHTDSFADVTGEERQRSAGTVENVLTPQKCLINKASCQQKPGFLPTIDLWQRRLKPMMFRLPLRGFVVNVSILVCRVAARRGEMSKRNLVAGGRRHLWKILDSTFKGCLEVAKSSSENCDIEPDCGRAHPSDPPSVLQSIHISYPSLVPLLDFSDLPMRRLQSAHQLGTVPETNDLT